MKMVRSAFTDENFLKYLDTFTKLDFLTVGLMLGQPTDAKDYIIHFTRTPPYRGGGENSPKKFTDLPDVWIADHARHVTRMLPGGMYVLGLFIVSQEDIFSSTCISKLKTILSQVHKKLNANTFLYGTPNGCEKLVLHYSPSSRYVCKNYNYETASLSNAEIKFQSSLAVKWLQIECKYELDQIFPIIVEKANWPLKKHMNEILQLLNTNLQTAVYFFDGEIKDSNECLETIGKKQKSQLRLAQNDDENKLMQVTIVLPIGSNSSSEVEILNSGGQIRLAGHVASKVWLYPKATVQYASAAIMQDIVRSLAARLEMHWDSLIEEEHGSPEDTNSVHETPRRVLVNLPTTKVTLSDYLFPGEGSQEAQISLSELLDIKVLEPDSILDVEGQPDMPELCTEGVEGDCDDILPSTTNKKIYIAGLGFAFVVLIISLLIHFIKG
ncbi:hypothetical protein RI129_004249 [Pyrocoelia pectoralis]|uniref:Protein odr-4 homolog n=1 Tax=Pyrocoelia pectoralis TaxID=417401 RepID=A0AAN7ZGN3_9COLE